MIQQTTIRIIILGSNQRLYSIDRIRRHKSKLFRVIGLDMVQHLPNADGDNWGYTCTKLKEIVTNDGQNSDFTIAITGSPLDDNYYIQRLGNGACVISYFMLTEAIHRNGNTVDNFILRNIYELEAIFRQYGASLADGDRSFVHDDTRGCLFDMNGWRENIVHSMHRPILCQECTARLKQTSLPEKYVDVLAREINRIKKPTYNQIQDLVKAHPWKAFVIASAWGIILNLFASIIYDSLQNRFTPKSSAQQAASPMPAKPSR